MSASEDFSRRTVLEQDPALLEQAEQMISPKGEDSSSNAQLRPNSELDGAEIVATMEKYLKRYVVLPVAAYLPIVLYAICTHVSTAFDSIGYIAVLSPTKGCGKTRLFEVLELFVRRPWRGIAPSVAPCSAK